MPLLSHLLFTTSRVFLLSLMFTGLSCTQGSTGEATQRRVYVAETESGYQLIKDGEPFFVKGACVGDEKHWASFKAAGGNTIRIYDPTNLGAKLDLADSLGLMVAVDIPLPEYIEEDNWYEVPGNAEIITEKITELVSAHKDHPALLFWILGNEVLYPIPFKGMDFKELYNSWISILRELDVNHPVTTTVSGMSRRTVLGLKQGSPNLDFISFNLFGSITSLPYRMRTIKPYYDDPFMITEWGINGPWEAREEVLWGAGIEKTSTKKAEQYIERYADIGRLDDSRMMGSFFFYWGTRHEGTPTWFSSILGDGRTTQVTQDISRIWGKHEDPYPGPRLGYILLEGQGAPSSITLSPGQEVTASIHDSWPEPSGSTVQWEIRPENWYRAGKPSWKTSPLTQTKFHFRNAREIQFRTPAQEGPYRLYLYLGDQEGRVATANIPFYVLNPGNVE